MKYKKHLVTAALPYANGPLHFGHIVGVYLPADIYVRHRRLQGHKVNFICGSDEHGVGVTIKAEQQGIPNQEWVDKWNKEMQDLFASLEINFDFFGRTSAEYHHEEAQEWFLDLYEKGLIGEKTEEQLYCIDDGRFLPDRYVEGTCYKCAYEKARGDECPKCGEWIEPTKLKNPYSTISGSKNIEVRETTNYFILLSKLEQEFKNWFGEKKDWRKLVKGFVSGLTAEGLQDRAISRDLDWGIEIPLAEAKGKRMYVWFEAPIGYVSNLKQYFKEQGINEDYRKDWWQAEDVEISHFIGKDNIIFHALIFPCMALATKFIKPPTSIPANEFMNFAGKQFSKSEGGYGDAREAVGEFGADALRFYLCSAIPETGDSNFSWEGFDLSYKDFGNKIGNFVHRSLSFLTKNWPDGISKAAFEPWKNSPELENINSQLDKVTQHLDNYEFIKAQNELLMLGQFANEFFQAAEPWKQFKTDPAKAEITIAGSLLFSLALGIAMQPFVPTVSEKLLSQFDQVDDSIRAQIYQGEDGALYSALSNGYKSPSKPEVLLPRIDPDILKKWQES